MEKQAKIVLIISSVLIVGGVAFFLMKRKKPKKIENFWRDVIYGVLAHEGGTDKEVGGQGKKYTDLIDLDGGTIGICHFAAGGLCALYEAMDTQKYFGKSQSEMCNNWASKTSGAYQQSWWRDGFSKFLNNSKNNQTQINVCRQSRQKSVDAAIDKGWTTDRQLAIAVGVSNSYGNGGFVSNAKRLGWDAEKILQGYVHKFREDEFSSHKDRRRKMIDKWFPISLSEARSHVESSGRSDYMLMRLLDSDNKNYRWEVLPYGSWNGYNYGMKIFKNKIIMFSILGLTIYGGYKLIKRHIILREDIKQSINKFYAAHMTKCKVIGIHVRGTDSYLWLKKNREKSFYNINKVIKQ